MQALRRRPQPGRLAEDRRNGRLHLGRRRRRRHGRVLLHRLQTEEDVDRRNAPGRAACRHYSDREPDRAGTRRRRPVLIASPTQSDSASTASPIADPTGRAVLDRAELGVDGQSDRGPDRAGSARPSGTRRRWPIRSRTRRAARARRPVPVAGRPKRAAPARTGRARPGRTRRRRPVPFDNGQASRFANPGSGTDDWDSALRARRASSAVGAKPLLSAGRCARRRATIETCCAPRPRRRRRQ